MASGAMEQQIPARTVIFVWTIDRVDSQDNGVGQTSEASLVDDVVVGGRTIAARGANAELRVLEMKNAGKLKGKAGFAVTLDRSTRSNGKLLRVTTEHSTMTSASGGRGRIRR